MTRMRCTGLVALTMIGLSLALLAGHGPAGTETATAASPSAMTSNVNGARTITLVNRTRETIWPAAWPGSTSGRTGWRLPAGHSLSVRVPNTWNARLWARTGCHFDAAGRGPCQTAGCDGRFQCRGWGQIPATLAEYDLDAYDHLDFYDVSMVDGSNLPMYIRISRGRTPNRISANGCEQGHGCTSTVKCPPAIQVHRAGHLVACISPCARFGTARYCCSGPKYAHNCSPAKTWPIDYARVFKRAEPYAYSWSGDNSSTFACAGGCSYRIIFGVTPPAIGGPPG